MKYFNISDFTLRKYFKGKSVDLVPEGYKLEIEKI